MSVVVLFSLLAAPRRGLLARARQRRRQKWQFAQEALAVHLLHHEGQANAAGESDLSHAGRHMQWTPNFADGVVSRAEDGDLLTRKDNRLALTDKGRDLAREAMER